MKPMSRCIGRRAFDPGPPRCSSDVASDAPGKASEELDSFLSIRCLLISAGVLSGAFQDQRSARHIYIISEMRMLRLSKVAVLATILLRTPQRCRKVRKLLPKRRDCPLSSSIRPSGLEQEPCAPLGLIDPVFQQACGGNVAVLVAKAMRLAQVRDELLIVVAQLGQHIQGRDEICVIVQDPLQTADVADRAQRRAADLANTLGDRVGGGKDLVALLIQQKMIVAKMRTRDVPMKVLRLQIQRKHVGE